MIGALLKDFKDVNPFNKKTNPLFPVKEINRFNHYVKTVDNRYQAILKIIQPLNTDLMDQDDIALAIEIAEETLKITTAEVGFLISSEIQNIDTHLDNIAAIKKTLTNVNEVEEIVDIEHFLIQKATKNKNVHQFYYTITSQFKDEKNAIKELEELTKEIIRNLSRSDIEAVRLQYDQIREVFYQKLNPIQSSEVPYEASMTMNQILPYSIPDKDTYFVIDGVYYQTFAIDSTPSEVSPKWLSRVINAGENVDVSINLIPNKDGQVKSEIESRIRGLENKLGQSKSVVEKMETQKKIDEQLSMLEQLIQKDTKVYDTVIVLTLKSTNKDEMIENSKRLIQQLRTISFRIKPINNEAISNTAYIMPIVSVRPFIKDYFSFPLLSTTVAALLCFDSSTFYYPEGVLVGFINEVYPVVYNMYDRRYFSNPNEVVLGMSGTGKSFYMKTKIRRERAYRNVDKHIIIDPEGEFRFNNAKRINFKIGSKFTTNIFHIYSYILDNDEDDDLGKEEIGTYLDYKITECLPFFKWIYPQITNKELGNLQEAIKLIYKNVSNYTRDSVEKPDIFPTLSDLYDLITTDERYKEKLDEVSESLKPYVKEGSFASMFDGQTNWDFEGDIIIFVTKELNELVRPAMMDLLTKAIWEEIKNNPTIKIPELNRQRHLSLIIDEVHLMANKHNIQSLTFVNQIYKRIRKYYGKIMTATQNIQDLLDAGAMGQSIINNSFTQTFLGMQEMEMNEMKKFMSFTKAEEKLLVKRKATYGQCVQKIGSRKFKMQLIPTDMEIKIFDKKAA